MKLISKYYSNLTVKKKLGYSFSYLYLILSLIVAVGLTGFVNLDSKIKQFYSGPYEIESSILNSQISLQKIENYINRAYLAKQENAVKKYISMAEDEMEQLESLINIIDNNMELLTKNSEVKEISSLKTEMEKANRYRSNILEKALNGEKDEFYETYKNDYAPILDHISTELDSINMISMNYANSYVKRANMTTNLSIMIYLLLVVIGFIGVIIIGKVLIKGITEPINIIKNAMKEVSEGNLSVELDYHTKDEFNELCVNIMETINQLKAYIYNITKTLDTIAQKDMTGAVLIDFKGDFAPIKVSLTQITDYFNQILLNVRMAGVHIQEGADQIATTSYKVSQGASSQTNSIASLKDKISIMVDQVSQNSISTGRINDLTIDMEEKAKTGTKYMSSLVKAMEDIIKHTDNITQIINVINEIADQTHLLSINASIESARAGELGKGFGVVAGETRNLAIQCTNATQNTTELIDSCVVAMKEGFNVVKETEENFRQILSAIINSKESLDSIYIATKEEKDELRGILTYIEDLLKVVEENSSLAEESLATSEEFLSQSDILQALLEGFTLVEDL